MTKQNPKAAETVIKTEEDDDEEDEDYSIAQFLEEQPKPKNTLRMFERDQTLLLENLEVARNGERKKKWKKKKLRDAYRDMEPVMQQKRKEERKVVEDLKKTSELVKKKEKTGVPDNEQEEIDELKREQRIAFSKIPEDSLKHSDCLQLPTRIGDFYVTHKIGEGSFARVYIARPIDDARCVAVKMRKNWSPNDQEDESTLESSDEEFLDSEGETEVRKVGGKEEEVVGNGGKKEETEEGEGEETSSEEESDEQSTGEPKHFQMEAEVLRTIHRHGLEAHIPELLHYDTSPDLHYMAITLFGDSLRQLKLRTPERRLEPGTVARIGIQALYAIKVCHEAGFLHRDVKPANLMMGLNNDVQRRRLLHLIDFGLARRWAARVPVDDNENEGIPRGLAGKELEVNAPGAEADPDPISEEPADPVPVEEDWTPLPLRQKAKFRGTLRYASPNVHKRLEQGRVDDIWSLIYTLVDLGGQVPWAGEVDARLVLEMKEDVAGWLEGQPKQLARVVQHLLETKTLERPNYHLIFNSLYSIMKEEGEKFHSPYTWEDIQPRQSSKRLQYEWEDPDGVFFTIDYLGINDETQISATVTSYLEQRMQTEKFKMHPGGCLIDLHDDTKLATDFLHWKHRTMDHNRRLRAIGRIDYDVMEQERVLGFDVNALDKYKGDFDLEKAASSEKYNRSLDFGWMKVKEDEEEDEKTCELTEKAEKKKE